MHTDGKAAWQQQHGVGSMGSKQGRWRFRLHDSHDCCCA